MVCIPYPCIVGTCVYGLILSYSQTNVKSSKERISTKPIGAGIREGNVWGNRPYTFHEVNIRILPYSDRLFLLPHFSVYLLVLLTNHYIIMASSCKILPDTFLFITKKLVKVKIHVILIHKIL